MGVIFLNNNDLDMTKLLQMLSSMDKKDLEAGISKANEILKNNTGKGIIDNMNKKGQGDF